MHGWLAKLVTVHGATSWGILQHYVASSTRAVLIYVDPPLFFTVNLAQSVCRESIELLHVEVRGAV